MTKPPAQVQKFSYYLDAVRHCRLTKTSLKKIKKLSFHTWAV